jgi:hypothetical protein
VANDYDAVAPASLIAELFRESGSPCPPEFFGVFAGIRLTYSEAAPLVAFAASLLRACEDMGVAVADLPDQPSFSQMSTQVAARLHVLLLARSVLVGNRMAWARMFRAGHYLSITPN